MVNRSLGLSRILSPGYGIECGGGLSHGHYFTFGIIKMKIHHRLAAGTSDSQSWNESSTYSRMIRLYFFCFGSQLLHRSQTWSDGNTRSQSWNMSMFASWLGDS